MIELRMLPAKDGDCLLLSYGESGPTTRILIDGGRASTYPLVQSTLNDLGSIDLLVVTHVDQDHILGTLALLRDPARRVRIGQVWFNGYDQLHDAPIETFGVKDGEKLSTSLLELLVPWNTTFATPLVAPRQATPGQTASRLIASGGGAVHCDQPVVGLGGATFTILSPDRNQLAALIPRWSTECKKEGLLDTEPSREPPDDDVEQFGRVDLEQLANERFVADTSLTNSTSIAFLFEFEGRRLVFTGDADDARVRQSLRDKVEPGNDGRIRIDALKVSHHGSRKNISRDTLDLLNCGTYLISTDGSGHHHPNEVAMARILKHGGASKEVVFNYRSRAALWTDAAWLDKYGYTVRQPEPESDGFLTVTW